MPRVLKGVVIAVAVLATLLVGTGFALHVAGASRLAKGPSVAVQAIAIPSDDVSLARGAHLDRAVVGCSGCHGADLSGEIMIDDATFGLIVATNITSGVGAFGDGATLDDWIRAVKHGVGRDGRVLAAMPSDSFAHLSDDDLGAVLAHVMRFPPVDNALPARRLVFPGTVIGGFLMFDDLPLARITTMVPPSHPPVGTDGAYGAYLLAIGTCVDCHGADLRGLPPGTPGPPPGPDLSRAGTLGSWTESDFVHAMRTGIAPGARTLSPDMPFATFGKMTDDELSAMWAALQALH